MNQAITLGFSRVSWSIIPQSFDFFWQPPPYPYDPAKARQLLAEAGYPNGFDAGDFWCDAATDTMSEAAANYLQTVASGCGCGRWSGRRSSRATRRRS
jgi:ABC-type transport system substrate-binding protein